MRKNVCAEMLAAMRKNVCAEILAAMRKNVNIMNRVLKIWNSVLQMGIDLMIDIRK